MRAELVVVSKSSKHRHCEKAPGWPLEAGAVPNCAPAVLRDELLQRQGERVGVVHRAVYMGIAQNRPAVVVSRVQS
jgi:hypothetical protein